MSILSDLLDRFVRSGPSGCACAVMQDGKPLERLFKGKRDLEKGLDTDSDTVFRLYSMTKPIVCAAALILYERGAFLLNEPIGEYLPEFRDMDVYDRTGQGQIAVRKASRPILVGDAFSMTCGIPYGGENSLAGRSVRAMHERLNAAGSHTLRETVRELAKIPLEFDPGTHWLYGHGHELVAALIESVSGKSVGNFLKEEIFDPLGMSSTGYRYFGDIRERMAVAYVRGDDGSLVPMDASRDRDHEPGAVFEGGGSGLFSTLDDYARFASMLACGGRLGGVRILGRKTIDLMRANRLDGVQLRDLRNSYLAGYGYGLGVRTMMDTAQGGANTSYGEFGWTGALGTYLSVDPSERACVVYMHQMMPNMEEYHHLRVRAAAYSLLN